MANAHEAYDAHIDHIKTETEISVLTEAQAEAEADPVHAEYLNMLDDHYEDKAREEAHDAGMNGAVGISFLGSSVALGMAERYRKAEREEPDEENE